MTRTYDEYAIECIEHFKNHFALSENSYEAVLSDNVRGMPRIENAANLLLAAYTYDVLDQETRTGLAEFILVTERFQAGWTEYGYKEGDEGAGYYGTVPTSFCIFALAHHYEKTRCKRTLQCIIEGCDYMLWYEEAGYVRKSSINKNNVLNTSLLAALCWQRVAHILTEGSSRRKEYQMAANRVMATAMSFQKNDGSLPYQFSTPRTSLLYHLMAAAELRYLNMELKNPAVHLVVKKAADKFARTTKQTIMPWQEYDLKDKEGAPWAYGFALALGPMLPKDIQKRLDEKLGSLCDGFFYSSDTDETPDPFYSSWVLFGLSLAKQQQNFDDTTIPTLKPGTNFFLRLCYIKNYLQAAIQWLGDKVRNCYLPRSPFSVRYWK